MRVGVVITNYETWSLTARCIAALEPFRVALADCIVVDDHSVCGPACPLPDWVRVLRNPENLGLVRSLNRGLREAQVDVAVIFDSDARPLADFTKIVQERFSADGRLGVLGFRTVDQQGRETGSHEPEPTVGSILFGQRLHSFAAKASGRDGTLCVFTCAMAVRKLAFEELGGFDEGFDWLDLDLDLCLRAWRANWRVEHCPELVAFHQGSGAPQATRERVLRFYRNRWRLLSKFGKIRNPRLVRSLISVRVAVELLLLYTCGRLFLRRPGEWSDKTAGRVAILKWCLSGRSDACSDGY